MHDDAVRTRALVVEDDPNIVDLIRSNLAVRGFDTIVSADGLRALRLLETEEPDIVLLDLMLPEVDGFELCRQIREHSAVAIIEAHCGSIELRRLARGTCFRIRLPVEASDRPGADAEHRDGLTGEDMAIARETEEAGQGLGRHD